MRISILTAFLNESENLPIFKERLGAVLARLGADYEIVLVDDHSEDDSPAIAKGWQRSDARVRYLRLSRCFGSHAAYSAGLTKCSGDCVILLATDLQDPPEVIPQLLENWRVGFDVVWASRRAREGESVLTRLFSAIYYRLMRRFALPQMPDKGADFLLMDRKVVEAFQAISEKNTSFLAVILWMGFRQTFIDYVKQPRHAGRSKWNLSKKVKLLIDSMVSFSYLPIRAMSVAGMAVSFLGLIYAAFIISHAWYGSPVEGWSSLMVVLLVLGGCQLFMLGVLGEYLWRTFDAARGRPAYIIEEYVRSDPAESTSEKAA